jgi:hypothetical protein
MFCFGKLQDAGNAVYRNLGSFGQGFFETGSRIFVALSGVGNPRSEF